MPGLYDQIESHLARKKGSDTAIELYTRLNQQLDDQTTGLTTVDLMVLRGLEKKIMLTMIRDNDAVMQGITRDEIQTKVDAPEEALIESLSALTENGWLILLGEPPRVRYRVFMKRKRGSTLGLGIWSAINNRLQQRK